MPNKHIVSLVPSRDCAFLAIIYKLLGVNVLQASCYLNGIIIDGCSYRHTELITCMCIWTELVPSGDCNIIVAVIYRTSTSSFPWGCTVCTPILITLKVQ